MNSFTDNSWKSSDNGQDLANGGYLFSREKIQELKKRTSTKKLSSNIKEDQMLKSSDEGLFNVASDNADETSAQEIIRKRNTPIKNCDRSELSQFYNLKFSEMLCLT